MINNEKDKAGRSACRHKVIQRFAQINLRSTTFTVRSTVVFARYTLSAKTKGIWIFRPTLCATRNRFDFALDRVIWINSWVLLDVCFATEFLYECFFASIVQNVKQSRAAAKSIMIPRTRGMVYRNATLCTVNHKYHWSNGSCIGCFKAIAGSRRYERI